MLRCCIVLHPCFLGTAFSFEVVHPGLKELQAGGNLIFSPARSLRGCTVLVDSKKISYSNCECTTSLSGKLKMRLCFLSCCKQIVKFLVRSLVYASVVVVDNRKTNLLI